jgi:hypothetical protein
LLSSPARRFALTLALTSLALPGVAAPLPGQEPAPTPDPVSSPVPEPAGDLAARIDRYLQPFVDAGHLSGYLLVARDGETVYERGFPAPPTPPPAICWR